MALALDSSRPLALSAGLSKAKLQPEDIHVLLVDDERLSRTVVANMLRKCNYKVTTAENGAEAMELLRREPHGSFQLVLTDICMPQVNGIELLQLVKQDDSFRSVPVIMMSSIEQDETVLQCVEWGAEEYLVKPVTKKELQHIWQHVWRKQLASAATVPQVKPSPAAMPLVAEPVQVVLPAASPAVPATSPELSAGEPLATQQPKPAAEEAAPAAATAQPAPDAARQQQQQQQAVPQPGAALPAAVPVGDFICSPAGLDKRLKLFGAAVALLQSCHVHSAPLLRLRPFSLGITSQGLRVIDDPMRARQAQQQPGGAAGDLRALLDSLYASPEERLAASSGGAPTGTSNAVSMAADVFSLGALFVDLFLPRPSMQDRCAQLVALQGGLLPAELAGADATEVAPLRAFVQAIMHPEPRLRPMLAHLVRSGQLQEAYRLVQLLPWWRAKHAAQQSQQQVAAPSAAQASQQQPAADPAAAARQSAVALPQQPAAEVQSVAAHASPAAALAAPSSEEGAAPVTADYDGLSHFLRLLHDARMAEAHVLQSQLAAVDADVALVRSSQSSDAVAASTGMPAQQQQQQPAGELDSLAPPLKRRRVAEQPGAEVPPVLAEVPEEQLSRVMAAMPQLEELFFSRRSCPGSSPAQLDAFAEDLEVVSRRGGLPVKATLRCGDMASPMEMACCVAFDREDHLFATVGVSRRIKLFDFAACLESDNVVHYPVLQMATRSKLSSVSWNAYVRSRLVTADYDGLIQLWDAGAGGAELAHFDEHARRVWSVDFSRTDPTRFLSGSDDGTVRLWSMHDEASVLQIKAPANVCSVQFSPEDSHMVAFGCANYKVYAYDLRRAGQPLGVIAGPQRAVSYVRFMGGNHLVAASTDSTLRLWDLREALEAGSGSGRGAHSKDATPPQSCFRGHRNQRNFVGLSVTPDGYIACGSEDNRVHCYYRSIPFSIGSHQFAAAAGSGDSSGPTSAHPPFVSAVCWANRSRHLLAANSQGVIEVLHME